MPHQTDPAFRHISVTQLAPTFGAQVAGIDFFSPVSEDVFAEIKSAISKVGNSQSKLVNVRWHTDKHSSMVCSCSAKRVSMMNGTSPFLASSASLMTLNLTSP